MSFSHCEDNTLINGENPPFHINWYISVFRDSHAMMCACIYWTTISLNVAKWNVAINIYFVQCFLWKQCVPDSFNNGKVKNTSQLRNETNQIKIWKTNLKNNWEKNRVWPVHQRSSIPVWKLNLNFPILKDWLLNTVRIFFKKCLFIYLSKGLTLKTSLFFHIETILGD